MMKSEKVPCKQQVLSYDIVDAEKLIKKLWPHLEKYNAEAAKRLKSELEKLEETEDFRRLMIATSLCPKIINALNNVAPDGMHFGSSDIDNTCYGFFYNGFNNSGKADR